MTWIVDYFNKKTPGEGLHREFLFWHIFILDLFPC
jgi:hypothetical protein